MNRYALNGHITDRLEPARKKLLRSIDRSVSLRLTLLTLANLFGCALMLSPLIAMVTASAFTVYLYQNIVGPLDLFLLEVSAAISLFSAYLSIQLYLTRITPPSGVRVDDREAPELYSILARRVSQYRLMSTDRVILTPQVELNIQSTPRWPIPVFHTRTLCVGAPLLFFISPGQFRLALAGAVASSASARSSVTGWAIEASHDWPAIIHALEARPSLVSGWLLKPANLIASVTTALSKGLQVDRKQAQARWVLDKSDEHAAIDYLANQTVASSFLTKAYWPMIHKAAERSPTPVVKPFGHFELLLEKLLDTQSAKRWLLQAQANMDSDQPDLRDILAELSLDHLEWSGLPDDNAFHALFSSTDILKALDQYWQETIEVEWSQRHASFQNEKARFERLQSTARKQNLRGASALRYVKLASRFLDSEKAIRVFREMYHTNRNNASMCFACGQEMLRHGLSREGCDALQHASELDRSLAHHAHALINSHRKNWLEPDTSEARFATSA